MPDSISRQSSHVTGPAVPVAFVSSHAARGGAERYLSLLLSHLPRAWVNQVVALKHGGFVDDLRELGHPVEVIDTGPGLADLARAARRLRQSFVRSRPAVVHANGLKAALVAELATVRSGPPVIWFKHDVSRDGWLTNLVGRRAALVVGVSHSVIESLGGASRRHAEVLNCQLPAIEVDPAAARRTVLTEFAPDGADTVVALVARLDAYKGHGDLVAAMPAILDRAPRTRFLFVGGDDPAHPDQRAALEAAVADRGLEHAVRFTGFRSDALELISGSDVLAIPSIATDKYGKEGFPYVGLEALAVGTPIVAYAQGGLPEQVGRCGVLVPPGDRRALGEAIVSLVEDPERRRRLAVCGQERFDELFRWSTLADDVAERYRRVAETSSE